VENPIKEIRAEDNQNKVSQIMIRYNCRKDDAILLIEIEEVLALVNRFMSEGLDMEKNLNETTYRAQINGKDFAEHRLSILLRITNVQNLLMSAHPDARNVWGDLIKAIITKLKDLQMAGEKLKAYEILTDLMVFRQEIRNFIERGDVARLMALKGHALPDAEKIYFQAMRSIGTSHQAKWIYTLLVKTGKGIPMTAEHLASLTGYNEKTVSDALTELREKGSMILECGYAPTTGGRPAQTYWIPEVFRMRYMGD
jgi:hypothetical protein